jgi:hypothetical protein
VVKPISRRTILRSASGLAIALPFLEAMAPRRASAAVIAPKRFFVWYTPVGTVLNAWRPTGTGSTYTVGEILKPIDTPTLRSKTTILSGLRSSAAEKLPGNGHAKGMTTVLTARPYTDVKQTQFGDVGWGAGVSIDQFLAKRLAGPGQLPSIEAGVLSSSSDQGPSRFMSYSGSGQANIVPAEDDPRKIFSRLFTNGGSPGSTVAELEKLARQRKSVLDTVKLDFARLNGKLGAVDRERLDKHLTLIREVESQIGTGGGTAQCKVPTAPSFTNDQVKANSQLPALGKTMMDLLATGLACDSMRVASLLWSAGESYYNFSEILPDLPWKDLSCPPNVDTCTDGKNLPASFLHVMSHFPPSTANGVPTNMNTVQKAALQCLTAVEVWFSQQLAYFAQKLADTPDVDGRSVLDNTVLLSVKDIAEGVTHGFRDVPHVLLGGTGLFKTGHLNFNNSRTPNDLFIAIAQALGLNDVTTFGDPAYVKGSLTELLA